ncbi:MAG: hypothetical protein K0S36_2139 [Nitrosospira multiformis]|nr:hypothetical protein [Nitrosospira multiformis]
MTLPVVRLVRIGEIEAGERGGTAGISGQGDGGQLPRSKPLVCIRREDVDSSLLCQKYGSFSRTSNDVGSSYHYGCYSQPFF